MSTESSPQHNPNNERLKALVAGAGLTQAAAMTAFNKGIKVRPLSESAWKAYFCQPGTARYRNFRDDLLVHAEAVFGKLQKPEEMR
ncbi:hypothetical protein [Acidovorax sp. sic0104]|uniref:hypothetical protein n=1 Tax=Acidovorax sp. sic0104 TaxID=2854784 RepID=UPI001C48598B|nr:hypothetical protein [Acidovorax sp. sic0104]MBV7541927.1 hypothetical protein [Acidovorax sp. sic0104]